MDIVILLHLFFHHIQFYSVIPPLQHGTIHNKIEDRRRKHPPICVDRTVVCISVSLTISEDDESNHDCNVGENNGIEASTRILPGRRSQPIVRVTSPSTTPLTSSLPTKKFVRHFLQETYATLSSHQQNMKSLMNSRDGGGDEFDRPLIRLKYGGRVQVVSMYSRGSVKLARGCGHI